MNAKDVSAMAMPLNLVLVRHGESWLNWVLWMLRHGRGHEIPAELVGTPGWQVRLTDQGREQARSVRTVLDQTGINFGAGYCSPFIRTIETASLMIPNAPIGFWRIFAQIRERDWGDWECVPSVAQFDQRREHLDQAKSGLRMFWSPPGGESGNDAILRARDMIGTIVRSSADNVILSCHGELIEFTLRMFNDWGTLHDWQENEERWGYLLSPVNCQVIHLTRVDPESGSVFDYLRWARSYVPWDPMHTNNRDWEMMERKRYSGADLSQIVAAYPANY